MKFVLKSYLLNIGILFAISHIFIFITTNSLNLSISIISFILCFMSVTSSHLKSHFLKAHIFKREHAPLFITGIALVTQSLISFYDGYTLQACIGLGFGLGNLIKALELDCEGRGQYFLSGAPLLKTIIRPELMVSLANIALSIFSSAIGPWFLPILFLSLFISFLPHWRGARINYAWARGLLTLFYALLFIAASFSGHLFPMLANLFLMLGSLMITLKMNANFKNLSEPSTGFLLTKPIW